MIDTDGLCVATPPARTRTWLWLTITALIFCGLGLTVSTDVFFSLLLAGPMSCLAGVEVVRTFSELVHRHRRIEERALRRAFLNERKPFLRLASKS